jgi:hypothetical protein
MLVLVPRKENENDVEHTDGQQQSRVRMREAVYLVNKKDRRKGHRDWVRPQTIAKQVVGQKSVHEAVEEEVHSDENACAVDSQVGDLILYQVKKHIVAVSQELSFADPHNNEREPVVQSREKKDSCECFPCTIECFYRDAGLEELVPVPLFQ